MMELGKSKDKYKEYVALQVESIENIVHSFGITVNLDNFFLLLTRSLQG